MKLSEETVDILKNFSTINNGLLFKAGNVLSTVTQSMTVLAIANVQETFPREFAIYDLNRLLAKLSLYKDCELEFLEDRVKFISQDGKRTDSIRYCSPRVINSPPDKKVTPGEFLSTFELSAFDLQWQRKSAGISGSKHFVFVGDGSNVLMISNDMEDDSSDVSTTQIGTTDKTFTVAIKADNFKIIDGDYTVNIARKSVKFEHKSKPLEYHIALDSKFTQFNE
jgi:hypothetical protein